MDTLKHYETIRRFLREEHAATAIEYAMIAAGIAVAINALGVSVKGMYESVQTALG